MNLNMKLNTTTFWQVVVWVSAVLDYALTDSPVPPKYKPYVTFAAMAVSLALHQHSGKRDTQGNKLPQ